MNRSMLTFLIVLVCVGLAHSITEEESKYFGTTGQAERNTGIVGWVTISSTADQEKWVIESNDIPDHETGTFPVHGINPNSIEEQYIRITVPKDPKPNAPENSTCLPMGPIAIAVNGVFLFNPWDEDGDNAVEGEGAEIFDLCDGHPDVQGQYHYHRQPSSCLFEVKPGVPSPMVGVAFDGFAIYGPVDENGITLTSSDLDSCHGRKNSDDVYQYHTTSDFPYILGCFTGTPRVETSGRCYKADDADENGDVGNGGNLPPPFRHRLRRAGPPADARIPKNLFQRRLPEGYRDFLQKVIFGR